MQPTILGLIAVIFGVIALPRPMTVMLMVILVAGIFGAASAVTLTALGGSSVQPAFFMLLFLGLRLLWSPGDLPKDMLVSLKDSIAFAIFAAYGLVSAFLFPRLFANQIELPPTRVVVSGIEGLYAVSPLGPTSQNITQATYLLGSLAMLVGTIIICRRENRSKLVADTLLYLSAAHVALGLIDLVSNKIGFNALGFLRNGSYAVLDQNYGSFYRIKGTFSESSGYSAYGYVLLVFCTELWMRGIRPIFSGWAALSLVLVLLITTSSAGYVGIAAYAVVLLLRLMYFPSRMAFTAMFYGSILAIFSVLFILLLVIFYKELYSEFGRMFLDMTVNKGQSFSGLQRGFWVKKSWEAFVFSKGLGVGVGSFRSSSLLSAIAGSMGVIGVATFAAFVFKVLPFYKLKTYSLEGTKTQGVGSAAAWAATLGLAPSFILASNPDPGMMFAFLAGVAIAWAPFTRPAPSEARRRPGMMRPLGV